LSLDVFEASCGEVNCPVEEVKLTWLDGEKEEKLRLGRGKEKFSNKTFTWLGKRK